jgi:hypothetical protein
MVERSVERCAVCRSLIPFTRPRMRLSAAFLKHGPTTADLASVLVTVENMTPRKVCSAGFRCLVKVMGAVIAVAHIGMPVS